MTSAMQDDLAYLRDLAEAGQDAPLLGGRFFVWWGGVSTLAYAIHFGLISGHLDFGPAAYAWLWIGYLVIGILGQAALARTLSPDKPGQSSPGNKVEANVWMIAGFALLTYFGVLMLKFLAGGGTDGFAHSIPVVFTAYAISMYISGAMGKTAILKWTAYASLIVIALAVWFQGTEFIWAVAAFGAFVTVFLPGVALLRAEPKSLV